MPRAPVYKPQVREQATPNVRVSTDTPDLKVSNASSKIGDALSKSAGSAIKFFEEEKKQADDVAALEVDSELSEFTTDYLYNPKSGALNRKGKDAFGAAQDFEDKWRAKTEEILPRISNGQQRLAFEKIKASRYADVDKTLQKHISVEAREYDNEVTESFVKNERNAAASNYLDNRRIKSSIDSQVEKVIAHAGRNGFSEDDEPVKGRVLETKSRTHTAVLSRMLVSPGKEQIAKKYFSQLEVGKDITPADAKAIEGIVKEGGLRGDSQALADEMMNKYASRSEGLKEIAKRTKDNPELREAAEKRFENQLHQKDLAKKEAQETLYDNAAALVRDRMKSQAGFQPVNVQDAVPPDMWTGLDGEKRKALTAIAEEVPNDNKVWIDFLDLTPVQLAKTTRTEFETKYWSKLDPRHRARAEEKWDTSRNSSETSAKVSMTLSFDDRVRNTLKGAKLIPADKKRAKFSKSQELAYAKFEDAASREVDNFERTELVGKRKATGEEMQKIMNKLLVEKLFVDDGFFRDSEVPVSMLTDEQKAETYVPIKDIPTPDRNAIENRIRSGGGKVTDDKIQRAYAAWKLKDRARHDAIIKEK